MQFTVSRSFTVLTSVLGWVLESSDSMLGRHHSNSNFKAILTAYGCTCIYA